jgi:DNA-binding XRE family transcriptional regulator
MSRAAIRGPTPWNNGILPPVKKQLTTDGCQPYGDVTVTNLARLKRKLKRRGYTQDDLAKVAGCDRTYINHFFAGRRAPRRLWIVLEALAQDAKQTGTEVA